ncbi:GAF domain-containing protein [Streptomyces fumanus]|uniref:GAF domain-containing protein n=1 Tax=Streptomyces fumanus TaxID=67302 RepID=UPI0033D0822D
MSSRGDLAAVVETLRLAPTGGLIDADPADCALSLGVDGVAVSALMGEGASELLWATSGASTVLEDLQYTLGEGPGPDVATSCAAVLVPDLTKVPADRWPALLPQALRTGVEAVFCLPLHIGGACLGTFTLQCAAAGPLSERDLADAWIVANTLTSVLVRNAERWTATAEDGSDLYRAVVHQAAGMISVQAEVSLAEALLLLRAHAFRQGTPVVRAAEDVVARRVHFRNDGDEPGASGRRRDCTRP